MTKTTKDGEEKIFLKKRPENLFYSTIQFFWNPNMQLNNRDSFLGQFHIFA